MRGPDFPSMSTGLPFPTTSFLVSDLPHHLHQCFRLAHYWDTSQLPPLTINSSFELYFFLETLFLPWISAVLTATLLDILSRPNQSWKQGRLMPFIECPLHASHWDYKDKQNIQILYVPSVCNLELMTNIDGEILSVNCYKEEVYEIGRCPRRITRSRLESHGRLLW